MIRLIYAVDLSLVLAVTIEVFVNWGRREARAGGALMYLYDGHRDVFVLLP